MDKIPQKTLQKRKVKNTNPCIYASKTTTHTHKPSVLDRTRRAHPYFTLTAGEVGFETCVAAEQQKRHHLSPTTKHGDIHNILTGKSCGKESRRL